METFANFDPMTPENQLPFTDERESFCAIDYNDYIWRTLDVSNRISECRSTFW